MQQVLGADRSVEGGRGGEGRGLLEARFEAKEARERENFKVLEASKRYFKGIWKGFGRDFEATLQAEEQQSDAERRRLEVATITAREETRKVESMLTKAGED